MVGPEASDEELRGHLAAILLAAELIADAPSLPDDLRAPAETLHSRTRQLACVLAERAASRGCDCCQWATRVCLQSSPPESSGRATTP